MDLSAISIEELQTLLTQIPEEITRRKKSERKAVLEKMEALAASAGFSLEELISDTPAKAAKPKRVVAVKYRHPDNAQLTWTGRGKKPGWVLEWIAAGHAIEALAV